MIRSLLGREEHTASKPKGERSPDDEAAVADRAAALSRERNAYRTGVDRHFTTSAA